MRHPLHDILRVSAAFFGLAEPAVPPLAADTETAVGAAEDGAASELPA